MAGEQLSALPPEELLDDELLLDELDEEELLLEDDELELELLDDELEDELDEELLLPPPEPELLDEELDDELPPALPAGASPPPQADNSTDPRNTASNARHRCEPHQRIPPPRRPTAFAFISPPLI